MKHEKEYKLILAFGEPTLLASLYSYFKEKKEAFKLIFLQDAEIASSIKELNVDYQDILNFERILQKADKLIYLEEIYKRNFSEKIGIVEQALEYQVPIFSFLLLNFKKEYPTLEDFKLSDLYIDNFFRATSSEYKAETVLITGAAGFIGKGITRRFAEKNACLVLIDNSETELFYLQQELNAIFPNAEVNYFLNDICDTTKIEAIFQQFTPTIVIHAAAFKHVAFLENQISGAIKNNVIGTYFLLKLAENYNTRDFLLISTDKAVEPISVMGKTKAIAEKLVSSFAVKSETTNFNSLRFGNVLGSTGSVLPLFEKQFSWNSQLLLTNPKASRYFYTLNEVSELLLKCLKASEKGVVFSVLPTEQITIKRLANLFLSLKKSSFNFQNIDLKPGEKLQELLISSEEKILQKKSTYLVLQPKQQFRNKLETEILNFMENKCSEEEHFNFLNRLLEI
ncbi:SDR family NAD(P)-dependent oxidoreductase [Zunongwangia sp.]|uniref:SDR family NAD(P)-dependent oxidoreductase n=1 Tax=Zunongwangia sp. TaxID=1965325 RepID=UPI003AA87C9C